MAEYGDTITIGDITARYYGDYTWRIERDGRYTIGVLPDWDQVDPDRLARWLDADERQWRSRAWVYAELKRRGLTGDPGRPIGVCAQSVPKMPKMEDEMSDWIETAKRLAEQPWWEWRSGMRVIAEYDQDHGESRRLGTYDWGPEDGSAMISWAHGYTHTYPDLTDDATAGVLLGMLERASSTRIELIRWGDDEGSSGWVVEVGMSEGVYFVSHDCDHRGHAIALALMEVHDD